MAINYQLLINKLDPHRAYSAKQLEKAWGIKESDRSHRIKMLMKKGMLKREGNSPQSYKYLAWNDSPTVVPEQPTTLDDLIQAASKLGTEHKIMKAALLKAKADIEKALEVTT